MLVLVYTVPALYRDKDAKMVNEPAPESKTNILAKPCFNCGFVAGQDINDFDKVPAGSVGRVTCPMCGVTGPNRITGEDALTAWNDLHDRMQASKAYNTLAGVSSPMEFAGWVKTMKEHAEEILKTKAGLENKKRMQDAWDAMSEAAVVFSGSFYAFGEAVHNTAEKARRYKIISDSIKAAISSDVPAGYRIEPKRFRDIGKK